MNFPADPKEANNDGDPIRDAALPPEIVNPLGMGLAKIGIMTFFVAGTAISAIAAEPHAPEYVRQSIVACDASKSATIYADAKAEGLIDEMAIDRAGKAAGRPACGIYRGEMAETDDGVKLVDGVAYHVTTWSYRDRRGAKTVFTASRSRELVPSTATAKKEIDL